MVKWGNSIVDRSIFRRHNGDSLHSYINRLAKDPSIVLSAEIFGHGFIQTLSYMMQSISSSDFEEQLGYTIKDTISGGALSGEIVEFWNDIDKLRCYPLVLDRICLVLFELLLNTIRSKEGDFRRIYEQEEEKLLKCLKVMRIPIQGTRFIMNKLGHSLREKFIEFRSQKLFDYTLDYPASYCLIIELKEALSRDALISVWRPFEISLRERLLHIAIESTDIIAQVVISIEPLRVLDPSGFILDHFCKLTKAILTTRNDAKGSIINLFRNLSQEPQYSSIFRNSAEIAFDSSDAIYFVDLPDHWKPDPLESINTPVEMSSKCGTAFDILANFFDSSNDFINEYKKQLAESLFSNDLKLSDIIIEIELLKAKLSSSVWNTCDVMINDCEKTMRQDPKMPGFRPFILSHVYWPLSVGDEGKGRFETGSHIQHVEKQYNLKHPSRTLKWQYGHDKYDIRIDFPDGSNLFQATFYQKSVIEFIDCNEVPPSVRDITSHYCNDPGLSMKIFEALQFWIKKRVVILHSDGLLSIAEHYDPKTPDFGANNLVIEAANKIKVASLDQFWSYIVAMLTNLGEMKLERIHSTLGMFANNYKGTIDTLSIYLNQRLQSGDLMRTGSGAYSLPVQHKK